MDWLALAGKLKALKLATKASPSSKTTFLEMFTKLIVIQGTA